MGAQLRRWPHGAATVGALVTVVLIGAGVASTPVAARTSASGSHAPKAGHRHVVVTEADSGKTVTLHHGDTLTLVLHGGGWTIQGSSNREVLRQDTAAMPAFTCPPNAMCATPSPSPAQTATFTAASAGSATVSASRAPRCQPGQMCPMFVQLYRLQVTVTH